MQDYVHKKEHQEEVKVERYLLGLNDCQYYEEHK